LTKKEGKKGGAPPQTIGGPINKKEFPMMPLVDNVGRSVDVQKDAAGGKGKGKVPDQIKKPLAQKKGRKEAYGRKLLPQHKKKRC